jgi:type VII secretion integral membrane protein EccD
MNTIGLVRITVAAPHRRIDLALPDRSFVAELLPGLLNHAGEHLADQGVTTGGWVLRREDGSVLDGAKTLASQRVLDGEVLNLAPARMDWPELEYDDLVAAIAAGSARAGRTWGPCHTRWAGLTAGAVAGLLGLLAVLWSGPPWPGPATAALAVSALMLGAGTVLSRVVGDAGAGAVVAAVALPFAFTGGGLLFAGDRPVGALGAAHLLAACAALLLAAVAALLGVVDRPAVFVAAATTGALGVLGAWPVASGTLDGTRAAAVVAGAGLVFSPVLAKTALRLARMPLPVLPRGAADLLRDTPQPPRSVVYATVVRADALLTGMVSGVALAAVVCQALLIRGGGASVLILIGLLTVGFGLRARLHPVLAQRVALLVASAAGAVCLVVGPLMADRSLLLTSAGPVLVALGVVAVVSGLRHGTREFSPFLGRYAELLEIAVVLAVVPVVCSVLGLYGFLRGLGG